MEIHGLNGFNGFFNGFHMILYKIDVFLVISMICNIRAAKRGTERHTEGAPEQHTERATQRELQGGLQSELQRSRPRELKRPRSAHLSLNELRGVVDLNLRLG